VVTGRVTTDLRAGVMVAEFSGELTLRSKDVVRTTVYKCLVECPSAVLVDLGELVDRTEGGSVSMLYALQRAAAADPGVPLVWCRPRGLLAERLRRSPWRDLLPVYPTKAAGLAAIDTGPLPGRRVRAQLPVDPSTPRVASGLAFSACVAWGKAHVAHRLQRVVSELVDHSLAHAGTEVEIWLSLRGSYIYVAVRDGDVDPPRMRDVHDRDPIRPADIGRGLRIVEREATKWGCLTGADGKLVWALLSVRDRLA
jgi:hypothetical protein